MNYKMMGRFLSMILAVETIFMIPPTVIGFFEGASKTTLSFVLSIVIGLAIAGVLALLTRGAEKRNFYAREGLLCVGIGWLALSLVGALPLWLSGEFPLFIDAFFEIVSGFTTTGSSVSPNVEALSKAVNYWRCFTHWVGGMGVLVFLLAIVPEDGKGSGFTMHLLRAESPGPDVGKLVPKMRRTAATLYVTYIVMTVITFLFLIAGNMSVFDAVCTAFGTAGTGGFGIKVDSMAGYSPYIQWVCAIFMVLFGINFNCYYLLILKKISGVLRDEELRLYLLTILGSSALIALNIGAYYKTVGETIRHAAFQVASIITTTGYATTDFDLWPTFSKTILLFLMVIGACAGSTGGGIKCARVLLLVKGLLRNISQMLHPNKVQVIRVNKKPVSERILTGTNAYLCAYVIILVISTLIVSIDGQSFTTTFTAVLSCFNNVGPGLDAVGPTCHFGELSVLSKLVLSFDMLAGRLEIFPMLMLFNHRAWKSN
ncbi:MAG: TrkH family potassium uptake protein [Clostridia bacterium]|nr:TrkH family potassium uptake protein [Clostridia bacterium]